MISRLADTGAEARPLRKRSGFIYSFVEQPSVRLQPQGQLIIDTLKRTGPLPRYKLVAELEDTMETRSTVTRILAYQTKILLMLNAIQVETPEEYAVRLELEKRNILCEAAEHIAHCQVCFGSPEPDSQCQACGRRG